MLRKKSSLVVIGSCLAVYVALAVCFRWLMVPTDGKTTELAAYKAQSATVAVDSPAPFVPPAASKNFSSLSLRPALPSVPSLVVTPEAPEKSVNDVPRKKRAARAVPRPERPPRQVRERQSEWGYASGSYGNRPWF
jgi:hypothetical protein